MSDPELDAAAATLRGSTAEAREPHARLAAIETLSRVAADATDDDPRSTTTIRRDDLAELLTRVAVDARSTETPECRAAALLARGRGGAAATPLSRVAAAILIMW